MIYDYTDGLEPVLAKVADKLQVGYRALGRTVLMRRRAVSLSARCAQARRLGQDQGQWTELVAA
jgi:hypothetical protein